MPAKLRIGIDATNIRSGGGLTHLSELLKEADPFHFGIDKVIVFASTATLDRLEARDWLVKVTDPIFEEGFQRRALWQHFVLEDRLMRLGCTALLVPGGSYTGRFHPVVAMSQNLLPFEWREARSYGLRPQTAKFLLLRATQSITFARAAGVIFLTRYAMGAVARVTGRISAQIAVIPHGVDERFRLPPRPQRSIDSYAFGESFRLLYVSAIAPYKHQSEVVEAVSALRSSGAPIALDLVGAPGIGTAALVRLLRARDPGREWLRWHGSCSHEQLHQVYHQANAFIFASSCENLPNILVEAMAAGLPIACSDRGPMPEVLGEAGFYFDPKRPASILGALRCLLENPTLRQEKANAAHHRASRYSWKKCADDTLAFVSEVTAEAKRRK